ncbi:hypothetical protein F5Y00DRAFT_267564 [Daldinia vernicosa]|uniref:uncharacterized protein n=1 Tax=Daldinia vernicosa TaxID=114800 RepID=UPI002007BD56|nr:uncharacterized protein F5Y00DRAFT_267564 [Daldinia vernicosa]KAI0854340.1 hypothetical protein F5Y00DRAFT_267564 [Daldinia vernicosa]
MHHFNQRNSFLSGNRPRRKPSDVLFDHQVYLHNQGTRYRWSEQQSKIFQDYVQEFPDHYAYNIESLLERLDLHGYEGIETKQGLNFKGKILIPKVLRKIINIITDSAKNNHSSNQRTSHNQNSDSFTKAKRRYAPRPMPNLPSGNTEPGHSYHTATQTPAWSRRLPSDMYGSQDLRRNDEVMIVLRSLMEKVHDLEDIIGVKVEDVADAWSRSSTSDNSQVYR